MTDNMKNTIKNNITNKTKKAVMYGAGNIGRGFIGQLLYESGYSTTFIDVDESVIDTLNERHSYPLRILMRNVNSGAQNDIQTDILIEDVAAIHGRDIKAVADAIANADLVATAVGANVLPRIAPNISAGLAERCRHGGGPLDILVCENLSHAASYLRGLVREHFLKDAEDTQDANDSNNAQDSEKAVAWLEWFETNIGFVDTSIGRMVPLQTPEMRDGDPLRICAEAYASLPADKDAFRAGVPNLRGIVPYSPFAFYAQRKLYIHNMGHALTAYCGARLGCEYIWQAISEPEVLRIVRAAMIASADALAKRYGGDAAELYAHVDDLLARFADMRLGDTVYRVGRDTRRKLAPEDRMVGALRMCREAGVDTSSLTRGMALAIRFARAELDMQPEHILSEICGINSDEPIYNEILARLEEG